MCYLFSFFVELYSDLSIVRAVLGTPKHHHITYVFVVRVLVAVVLEACTALSGIEQAFSVQL